MRLNSTSVSWALVLQKAPDQWVFSSSDASSLHCLLQSQTWRPVRMPARANAMWTLGHPTSIWTSSARRGTVAASGTTGCAHLMAGVQGKEQGCEASGGLSPMMLCPVVMDVLEESWAQDQNLDGEWSDMVLSMLEQDSQPNTVQPLAHCPTGFCLPLRSWSVRSHYLVPLNCLTLSAAKAEASSDHVVSTPTAEGAYFFEEGCLLSPSTQPSGISHPLSWPSSIAWPGCRKGRIKLMAPMWAQLPSHS